MLQPLIKQTKKNGNGKKIKAAYADGAPARAKKVGEAREIGYEGWKDKYKYGNRWAAETFFSGIKRTFGETSRAKSIEGVFQEVKLKFLFYNMLLSL